MKNSLKKVRKNHITINDKRKLEVESKQNEEKISQPVTNTDTI